MTCQECRAFLFPENPEEPAYIGGSWLPALCSFCSRKDSPEYIVERMEEEQKASQVICEIKNCPIWKAVAQLKQDQDAIKCEIVHIHAAQHEKKAKEKEGDGW